MTLKKGIVWSAKKMRLAGEKVKKPGGLRQKVEDSLAIEKHRNTIQG